MPLAEPRYSEADVREIMHLAANIDLDRAGSVTLPELRQIASEANVTAESLDAALAEYAAQQEASTPRARHLPKLALVFTNIGVGLALAQFAVGPLVMSVLPVEPRGLVRTFLGGASLLTSFIRGRKGREVAVLEFAARNTGLFTGFTAAFYLGIVLINGETPGQWARSIFLVDSLAFWAGSTAIGSVIAAWRSRSTRAKSDD